MENLSSRFSSALKTGKEILFSYVRHPHNYPYYLAKKGREDLAFYTACIEMPLLSLVTAGLTTSPIIAGVVASADTIIRGAQLLDSRRFV